jgi:uncharacterized protein with HEPN domain
VTEPREPKLRIVDMVENVRLAREFAGRFSSAAELAGDRMSYYAVVHALLIVGEAAKHVPPEVRSLAPDVPWSLIAGMRDRLIHGYDAVDPGLVWTTATVDGPATEPLLIALLVQLDEARQP